MILQQATAIKIFKYIQGSQYAIFLIILFAPKKNFSGCRDARQNWMQASVFPRYSHKKI